MQAESRLRRENVQHQGSCRLRFYELSNKPTRPWLVVMQSLLKFPNASHVISESRLKSIMWSKNLHWSANNFPTRSWILTVRRLIGSTKCISSVMQSRPVVLCPNFFSAFVAQNVEAQRLMWLHMIENSQTKHPTSRPQLILYLHNKNEKFASFLGEVTRAEESEPLIWSAWCLRYDTFCCFVVNKTFIILHN